jgi:hypothetical protein
MVAHVNTIRNLHTHKKSGNSVINWSIITFSKRTLQCQTGYTIFTHIWGARVSELKLWHGSLQARYNLKKKFSEELIAYFAWYDTGRIENNAANNSYIVACACVATATFLQSRCLATIGGYTYRHADWWKGFVKYVAEMGSDATIYVHTKLHKDRFSHSKVDMGGYTESMEIEQVYFHFSQN